MCRLLERLDELIQELDAQGRHLPNEGLSENAAQQIIALLRAGAKMRSGIHVEDYNGNKASLKHPASVGEACRDWDAALEEDV